MGNGAVPPYGVAIQRALASGDLMQMRSMATQAELWLGKAGDVRGFDKSAAEADEADTAPDKVAAALEELKKEITKLEGGR